jgi:truncated hemoglobin YjbI
VGQSNPGEQQVPQRVRPPEQATEQVESVASPAAGAELAPSARVIDLQRTAGNAAVGRLLSRSPATVRRRSSPRAAIQRVPAYVARDYQAMVEQLHAAMDRIGTDEEGIYVILQKVEKDPTSITKLKTAYRTKYGNELEAEIRSEMSGSELRLALELIGIKDDRAAADLVGTAPTNAAEHRAAATRLHDAMDRIGTDEEAIYGVLIPFRHDAAKLATLKTTYHTEFSGGLTGSGLEADIKDEMSGSELSYALYLLNAPPPAAAAADVTVNAAGTEEHTGTVPGGSVSVRTGAQFTAGTTAYTEGFSMAYQGGLASDTRWLQFIWREIVVTHPTKGIYRVNAPITTTGGTYQLTTDTSNPSYNTDSASATSPFYEAAFTDIRTADATTIYDQPGAAQALVNAELAGGATTVVSRAHFNTFLIRDFRPLHRVHLEVEWSFTSAGGTPRVQTVRSGGRATSLPTDMKRRLVQQYPNYEYIE